MRKEILVIYFGNEQNCFGKEQNSPELVVTKFVGPNFFILLVGSSNP